MAALIMEKCLTASDATSRLAVPRDWWKVIELLAGGGHHEVQLWVVDGATGMFWEFQCAVRQKGPYKKPVLQSGGWLKFVNFKGLRAGDKLILQTAVHEFRGTRFVLTAQRLAADGHCWIDM